MGKISDLITKYQSHQNDTGSTPVQIIILTEKILELTSHLRKHDQDFDSKRGLLKMVNQRRRLLSYLEKSNLKIYQKILADLKLKPKRAKSLIKKTKAVKTLKKAIKKTQKNKRSSKKSKKR